jgi:hypothetical protein
MSKFYKAFKTPSENYNHMSQQHRTDTAAELSVSIVIRIGQIHTSRVVTSGYISCTHARMLSNSKDTKPNDEAHRKCNKRVPIHNENLKKVKKSKNHIEPQKYVPLPIEIASPSLSLAR